MKWFNIWWYRYLFRKGDTPDHCSWLERVKCRYKMHPAGRIYYNPSGYEPDDRCKNCGDYI